MTRSAEDIARQQVYLAVAPLFLESAEGNLDDARAAAGAMIAGFRPGTSEEVLLVAQVIAYGLAGLDSMRRAAETPDLSPSTILRLRGNAASMQRAMQQCRRTLDQRRRQAGVTAPASVTADAPPAYAITEADLEAALQRAKAIMDEARVLTQPPVLPRAQAPAQPPQNRAARRAAKFAAKRAQRSAA